MVAMAANGDTGCGVPAVMSSQPTTYFKMILL